MKFVHPEILYALGALSIPIIVHLFNFRKFKIVYFSNVAFLREIQVETQSKSKLRHLLILLARMLAMSCIILAFAQPYIPLENTQARQGDRVISVYLDNSFSMEAQSGGAPLLEIARNKAIEVVRSYNATDKFQVLTNDFEGRHQRLVSREEAIQLLQEVDISPSSRNLSEVYIRQRDLLLSSNLSNLAALQFTDLQTSVADAQRIEPDTLIAYRVVPTTADRPANVYIDSAWFASPVRQLDQSEALVARVVNTSREARNNLPVELVINGQQKGVTTVDIPSEGSAEITIQFTHTDPGLNAGMIRIDDYPVSFDDAYYFGFEVLPEIKILGITENVGNRDAVWAVFGDDPYYQYTAVSAGTIDYSRFSEYQLIILNQLNRLSSGLITELEKFILAGGSVCVIPSAVAELSGYNDLLTRSETGVMEARISTSTEVAKVDYDHELFNNAFERTTERVDLPKLSSYYPIRLASRSSAQSILTLRNDLPLLVASSRGSGKLYVYAVPLSKEFSNLAAHAYFPSSIIRMTVLSAPSPPLSYTIGEDRRILVRNRSVTGDETFRLRDERTGFEFIPEHHNSGSGIELFVQDDVDVAGNFVLTKGDERIASIGFNYDRRESSTAMTSPEAYLAELINKGWKNASMLTGDLQTVGREALELEEGKKYWWSMIIWALIFLAAEVLLIKYWR